MQKSLIFLFLYQSKEINKVLEGTLRICVDNNLRNVATGFQGLKLIFSIKNLTYLIILTRLLYVALKMKAGNSPVNS